MKKIGRTGLTRIEVLNTKICINSKYLNFVKCSWDDKNLHAKFEISIDNAKSNSVANFDFYASIVNPNCGIKGDLIGAFSCFVGDACSGDLEFNEFCENFGYDNDSMKAAKIHKDCIDSLGKFETVFPNLDIYDFINDLQEKYEDYV